MREQGRKLALAGMDVVLITAAYVFAHWLRRDLDGERIDWWTVGFSLPFLLAISLLVHLRLGLFNAILRYASIDTAVTVLQSVVLSVLLFTLAMFLSIRLDGIPRGILLIYGLTSLFLLGGSRLAFRFRRGPGAGGGEGPRVLLYGAGDTAAMVLQGLKFSTGLPYAVTALVDDDPAKRGRQMHGLQVRGGGESIPALLAASRIDEIWICVSGGLPGEKLRQVYEAAGPRKVRVRILPRLEHALLGTDLSRFHDPDIVDLLRRPPRKLDRDRMREWIRGRRVLVTGAGGSIGSELCRQVAGLEPAALALCDASEFNLFEIHGEMSARAGGALLRPFLTDVRDADAVRRMIREARPDVVFHAAAYKHVPLVELNPCDGILTNVGGLQNVATAALDEGVREFVFISTDKAVRPVNVMGATKRLGENLVQVLNREGKTRFTAVRFGNVLGSSGSVVPIFQEQVRKGGPVTVTHPDMTRYFMLISEAVELVIQAGSIGKGGEIFILDMGKPVRIADMAQDLIRLMGKEPGRDVRIEFSGLRPGEKIHEELLISPEDGRTAFPDIFIDHEPPPAVEREAFEAELDSLYSEARAGRTAGALAELKRRIPLFEPTHEATLSLIAAAEARPIPARIGGRTRT